MDFTLRAWGWIIVQLQPTHHSYLSVVLHNTDEWAEALKKKLYLARLQEWSNLDLECKPQLQDFAFTYFLGIDLELSNNPKAVIPGEI